MTVLVRPFRPADATQVAELLTAHTDSPNAVAGGVDGADVIRELRLRHTVAFLVIEGEGQLFGTFGLFRTSGRRTTAAGEVIADMLYLSPRHRGGVLTARLFGEALQAMFRSGFDVLRLAVNPANTVALGLYRRLGSVCVGSPIPGADGNIELTNHVPLILRALAEEFDAETRAEIAQIRSFGGVVERRSPDLAGDVEFEDGRPIIRYGMHLGGTAVRAVVDPRRNQVVRAELHRAGHEPRTWLGTPPRPAEPRPAAVTISAGPIRASVDPVDGLLEVCHEAIRGPVFRSTLPNLDANHLSGWRQSQPRNIAVCVERGEIQIAEVHASAWLRAAVAVDDGGVSVAMNFGGVVGKDEGASYQIAGLRHGTARAEGVQGASEYRLGAGLGLRDSSEIFAAGAPLAPDASLTWQDTSRGIRLTVSGPGQCSWITTGLVLRAWPPGSSTLKVRIEATAPAPEIRVERPRESRALAIGPQRGDLVLETERGVLRSWRRGSTRVLRCPGRRRAAFGSNPAWSGGLWISGEPGRADREHGIGWGANPPVCWALEAGWLVSADGHLRWSASHYAADDTEGLLIELDADGEAGRDVALWATPASRRDARVLLRDRGGEPAEFSAASHWETWCDEVSVQTPDGRWLNLASVGGSDPEIIVRSTAAGILLGAVCKAGPAAWRLQHGPAGQLTRGVLP